MVADQEDIAEVSTAHHDALRPRQALEAVPKLSPGSTCRRSNGIELSVSTVWNADAERGDQLLRHLLEWVSCLQVSALVDGRGGAGRREDASRPSTYTVLFAHR